MKRCYVMLVVLLAVALSAQAAIVPGGDFQFYKPGTGYTVTAELTGGGVAGLGDNLDVVWGGTAIYGDGTTGTTVDLPGWTAVTVGNEGNTYGNGPGGSIAFSAFGTSWGGPTRIQTTGDLGVVGTDGITISAMLGMGGGGVPDENLVFILMAGTTEVAGVTTIGAADSEGFRAITTAIDASALAGLEGQAISIILGTIDGGAGARSIWSDVSMVPEPATMALLALGGLLIRRKRA